MTDHITITDRDDLNVVRRGVIREHREHAAELAEKRRVLEEQRQVEEAAYWAERRERDDQLAADEAVARERVDALTPAELAELGRQAARGLHI